MRKYWLLFVLCGTIGACAISPAEDTPAGDDAVSSAHQPHANAGKGQGTSPKDDKVTRPTDDKGVSPKDGKGCPGNSGGTKPSDFASACKQLLAVVRADIDAAIGKGDQKQAAALKARYTVFSNECGGPAAPGNPGDQCTQALKDLDLQLIAAAKAGDYQLVAALSDRSAKPGCEACGTVLTDSRAFS